jgi:hypothetical protein
MYNDMKQNKKNMKKCDKRKSHMSNKSRMVNIAYNNDRCPVTKTFIPLQYTCRHFTSTQTSAVCGNTVSGSFCAQNGGLKFKLTEIFVDMFHLSILAVVRTMKQTKRDSA